MSAAEVVLIGGGGFAREVFHVIEDHNQQAAAGEQIDVVGLVDDQAAVAGSLLWARRSVAHLGGIEEWLVRGADVPWLIAIGDPQVRGALAHRLSAAGRPAARPVVHPSAIVNRTATLGDGTVVCPGAWIGPEVHVGPHTHVNVQTIVGHDAVLGEAVSLNPMVAVCGNALIGDRVLLGAGATVLEGLRVGDGARVGAGACVVTEVEPGRTVVGVPARPIDGDSPALNRARAGTSRSAAR